MTGERVLTRLWEAWKQRVKGALALSLLLGFCQIYGDRVVLGIRYEFSGAALFSVLLYSLLWFLLIHVLYFLLNKFAKRETLSISFRFCFLFLLIAYIVPLLLKLPAANSMDVYHQINQVLGEEPLTTHHPVFHTLFLGLFIRGGLALGNADLGVFLFVLLETVFTAYAFANGLQLLKRLQAPGWVIVFSLLFFALSPHITGWIGQTTKDVYYSAFFVLFFTELASFLFEREQVLRDKCFWIIFLLSAVFLSLFRNNGFYVVAPTALVLIIRECRLTSLREAKLTLLLLLLLAALPFGMRALVNNAYGAEKGSVAEALSLPIQQTARLVREDKKQITPEEKKVINKVLPFKELSELYNETISDPVKDRFKKSASTEDVLNYLGVWAKEFFRAPRIYLEATARQNIYLLYMGVSNYEYYLEANGRVPDFSMFHSPRFVRDLRDDYETFLNRLHTAPVLSEFNNMALYVILSLLFGLYGIRQKHKGFGCLMLPVYLSELIIVAAPCILGHVRYAFPIIWTMPLALGVYLSLCRRTSSVTVHTPCQ